MGETVLLMLSVVSWQECAMQRYQIGPTLPSLNSSNFIFWQGHDCVRKARYRHQVDVWHVFVLRPMAVYMKPDILIESVFPIFCWEEIWLAPILAKSSFARHVEHPHIVSYRAEQNLPTWNFEVELVEQELVEIGFKMPRVDRRN